jgi:hypothetical protein
MDCNCMNPVYCTCAKPVVVGYQPPCACGKLIPCYQNPPCTNLVGGLPVLPALGTPLIRTEADLLGKLLREGGAIVNANTCTAYEIAEARCYGRLYRDSMGYGFVLKTKAWLDDRLKCEKGCC